MSNNAHNASGGEISLFLYGHLIRYAGEKTGPLILSIGPTEKLRDLMEKLKIPQTEIGFIAVNGCVTPNLDHPIHPGDEVKAFGLVGGG